MDLETRVKQAGKKMKKKIRNGEFGKAYRSNEFIKTANAGYYNSVIKYAVKEPGKKKETKMLNGNQKARIKWRSPRNC